MPSIVEHVAEADENLKLYHRLLADPECPPRWALTVLFYAAAHLGRAAAVAWGGGPYTSHHGFEAELRKRAKAPDRIYDSYRTLRDESESARYDVRAFSTAEVKRLYNLSFARFETWARAQVARETKPTEVP